MVFQKDYFSNLQLNSKRGVIEMATVPEAQEALNRFKMEAASEVVVQLHSKISETPIQTVFESTKNENVGVQTHQKQ